MYDRQAHVTSHSAAWCPVSDNAPDWMQVPICDGVPSADYLAVMAHGPDRQEFARGYLSGALLCAVLLLVELAMLAWHTARVDTLRQAASHAHVPVSVHHR